MADSRAERRRALLGVVAIALLVVVATRLVLRDGEPLQRRRAQPAAVEDPAPTRWAVEPPLRPERTPTSSPAPAVAPGAEPAAATEPSGSIVGTVASATGEVLEARVFARSLEDSARSVVERPVDDRGRFLLDGLEPAVYAFTAHAKGYFSRQETVRVATDAVRRDVALRRRVPSLDIAIDIDHGTNRSESIAALWPERSDGFPHPYVVVTEAPPVLGSAYGRPTPSGDRWNEDDATPERFTGTLDVNVPLPCYASVTFAGIFVQTRAIGEGDTELAFALRARDLEGLLGSLTVRFADEDGAPVDGRLRRWHPGQIGLDFEPRIETRTDDGGYRLTRLRWGAQWLHFDAEGYAPFHREVVVTDAPLDLGTIPLRRGHTVRGALVDAEGTRLPGEVVLEPLVDGRGQFATASRAETADGTFELGPLQAGAYVARAKSRVESGDPGGGKIPRWSQPKGIDVGPADVEDVTLVLRTADDLTEVFTHVLGPSHVLGLAVFDEAGLEMGRGTVGAWPRPMLLPGRYHFVGLEDGVEVARRVERIEGRVAHVLLNP